MSVRRVGGGLLMVIIHFGIIFTIFKLLPIVKLFFLPFDLHDVSARPPLSQQHFSVTSFQCPLLRILITQFIKRVVYNPDSKSSCLLIFLKTSNDFSDLFDILRTLQDTPPLSVESLSPSPHRCLRYRFTHFDRDQVHHNSIVPP